MAHRPAMRMNHLTGKLEAAPDKPLPDGMTRDGCMVLPTDYTQAARDAGIMVDDAYSHLKPIKRELDRNAHVGKENQAKGKGRIRTFGSGGTTKTVGTGASRGRGASEVSFVRQKGVVNTASGAKDVKRKDTSEAPRLKGKGKGGFASLGSMKEAEYGPGGKKEITTRKGSGLGGGASGAPKSSGFGGGKGGFGTLSGGSRPSSLPPKPQRTGSGRAARKNSPLTGVGKAVARGAPTVRKLGGGSGSARSAGSSAVSDRERRAAYFDKKFAKKDEM